MQALWKWSGLSDLAIFSILFGLIVTGHDMPRLIRAFGEPEIYRRHKERLRVSGFAIPALVALPRAFGLARRSRSSTPSREPPEGPGRGYRERADPLGLGFCK